MPLAPSSQIGKYRVIDLVGEGAMGIVYRAEDTVLDRVVAVKVMNDSIALQADLRDRFLREAQMAGSLSHPNVVTVYDFGETEGHLYIAMEYVPGVDLETMMLRRTSTKLQLKLEMIVDVLNGLAYAHKRGIVHRDVKPANIRIADDGRAKLMDFGVAHLAASTITRTGEQMGTPSYMAPEQVMGGRVTPASDIFAVGTVLYELIAGCKPFDGPTLHSVMFKIVSEEPTPLAEMVPGVPPALERVIQRALAKDAESRYQSALEMAADLTAVRAGLSGGGVSTLTLRATGIVPRRANRRIGRWAAAGVALAAIVALVWAYGPRRDALPPSAAPSGTSAPGAALGTSSASTPPRASSSGTLASAATPAQRDAAAPTTTRPNGRVVTAGQTPRPGAPTVAAPPAVAGRSAARVQPATGQGAGPLATETSTPAAPASPAASPDPRPTTPAPAPPTVVASVSSPAPAVAVASPAAAPDPARIPDAIAAYAHAIESRDVAELRQAYPGMTAAQERSFAQFFEAARSMKVTLAVAGVDQSGASADVRLVGSYEFVTVGGKAERQAVRFQATLRHDGTRWRLTSVR